MAVTLGAAVAPAAPALTAAAPPWVTAWAETFLVDSRYEAAPLLVVAGWEGSSLLASGLLCSSVSVVCFVWCRSVFGLTSSLVEAAEVVEVGCGRFPAETPNLKWPSPACRLPSFALAISSATTAWLGSGSGSGLGSG